MTVFPAEHDGLRLKDYTVNDTMPPEAAVFADGGILLGFVRYLARGNRWMSLIPTGKLIADGKEHDTFDDAMARLKAAPR